MAGRMDHRHFIPFTSNFSPYGYHFSVWFSNGCRFSGVFQTAVLSTFCGSPRRPGSACRSLLSVFLSHSVFYILNFGTFKKIRLQNMVQMVMGKINRLDGVFLFLFRRKFQSRCRSQSARPLPAIHEKQVLNGTRLSFSPENSSGTTNLT
jgi:hypothetical protein